MKLARALLPLLLTTVPASKAEAQLVYVTGQRTLATLNNPVRITFTLPNRLNSSAGATMPVSFSNTFNVWLGGIVRPAAAQAMGAYATTVSITVAVQ